MSSGKSQENVLSLLDKILARALIATSIFCYVGVLLLVFTSVAIRFFKIDSNILSFNVWSYDLTNIGVIWMVYMGAVIGVRNSDHISVTMIKEGLKSRHPFAGKILLILNDLLALGVILVFTKAVYSALMAARTQLLPRLPIMKFWWVLPIFSAFVLMAIYMVANLLRHMRLSLHTNQTALEKNYEDL